MATETKLTRSQSRSIERDTGKSIVKVKVRFDDEYKNGHNTFAITAEVYEPHRVPVESFITRNGRNYWLAACGCMHDEIAQAFPEYAHLIKWHLMSTDEPRHYVANTVYHADEHGPTHAWVYYTGEPDPVGIDEGSERLIGYVKAGKASEAEGKPGYRVVWDEKTAKVRNLDHARASAVWPEATDEDLTAPGLEERLQARLPALMAAFRADMEAFGFTW